MARDRELTLGGRAGEGCRMLGVAPEGPAGWAVRARKAMEGAAARPGVSHGG